jgi:hypothetical protein
MNLVITYKLLLGSNLKAQYSSISESDRDLEERGKAVALVADCRHRPPPFAKGPPLSQCAEAPSVCILAGCLTSLLQDSGLLL